MPEVPSKSPWKTRLMKPRLGRLSGTLRPAEILEFICSISTARRYAIEDANYRKIAPNRYEIEFSAEIYRQSYRLIEPSLREQWRTGLLEHLTNANSRQGRLEFRFAGPVSVEIREASDLPPGQVRVRFRHDTEPPSAPPVLTACLETPREGMRFEIRMGLNTIGRSEVNSIHLSMASVQEKKLVSGQHAYLRCAPGEYRLYDGSPGGQPSTNGTFVNGRRVSTEGLLLKDGDRIILAAIRPDSPDPDTPGVVVLDFRENCEA